MSNPTSIWDSSHDPHVSRGAQTVITAIVATSIALVVLCLRIYSRLTIARPGAEDWTILGAFAFSIALTALIMYEAKHGQGHHAATISKSDLALLSQVSF